MDPIAIALMDARHHGNPRRLSTHDVTALHRHYTGTAEGLTHNNHVHPRIDPLGAMCPVCDPYAYAEAVNTDDDATFAEGYWTDAH